MTTLPIDEQVRVALPTWQPVHTQTLVVVQGLMPNRSTEYRVFAPDGQEVAPSVAAEILSTVAAQWHMLLAPDETRAWDEQDETVRRLADLSMPSMRFVVDVSPIEEASREACETDTAHGPATVHLESDDWLCTDCAVDTVRLYQEPERTFGAEVFMALTRGDHRG